jgi:hypothetical protein
MVCLLIFVIVGIVLDQTEIEPAFVGL